jgi:hypothetical protein
VRLFRGNSRRIDKNCEIKSYKTLSHSSLSPELDFITTSSSSSTLPSLSSSSSPVFTYTPRLIKSHQSERKSKGTKSHAIDLGNVEEEGKEGDKSRQVGSAKMKGNKCEKSERGNKDKRVENGKSKIEGREESEEN